MKKADDHVLRRQLFSLILLLLIFGIVWLIATKRPDIRLEGLIDGPQPGYYMVTSVSDGDTIVVDMDGRLEPVRLIGVDTPETHKPDTPVQCWGPEATQYTQNLINTHKNQVRLEADPINTNRDRYERLLRYVYLRDGSMLNLKLVNEGQGFAYTSFPFERSEEFKVAGETAKQQNLGLWSSCQVITNQYGNLETLPIP